MPQFTRLSPTSSSAWCSIWPPHGSASRSDSGDDDARTDHPRARRAPGGSAALPDTARLTIYLGRRDRVAGKPAYRAVCDAPYRHGFAGASALLGVDGTNHGHPERIAASFDIIDALTGRHGLVASERVGGTRLARFNY